METVTKTFTKFTLKTKATTKNINIATVNNTANTGNQGSYSLSTNYSRETQINYTQPPELVSYFTSHSTITFRLNCRDYLENHPEEHCPISRGNGYSNANNSCSQQDCFVPGQWYKGKRTCTVSGRICQHWVEETPHKKEYSIHRYIYIFVYMYLYIYVFMILETHCQKESRSLYYYIGY